MILQAKCSQLRTPDSEGEPDERERGHDEKGPQSNRLFAKDYRGLSIKLLWPPVESPCSPAGSLLPERIEQLK